ncbi:MAG: DNA polymerase III subunit gamma/tau, partial [Petrimonas sp.]|jgi:DNA polymerase-3 subunit gamma/tau|nr:DNA polymerase III subunit gamma/tau [Petrimonas sp.]
MMLYKPKMLGNTVFEVEVNTEINKNYLDDYGNVILAYLRESLQNDDITMTIKISEATVVKKPLTSREIFDELVQKNPSLQKLSDEFDLELS